LLKVANWAVQKLGSSMVSKAKKVKDHDFRSEASGIVAPYGIYDVGLNAGVIVVGKSADTPEFAVNAIATWWQRHGRRQYPSSKRVLVLADSGGSNGASKWNPVEHRMFSEVSKNWAGHPLERFETLLSFVRNTKTETGLRVEAYLDEREYEKGIKVPEITTHALGACRGVLIKNDVL